MSSPLHAAAALALAAALASLPGCAGCESKGGDPLSLAPADARVAVVVPDVEALRQRLVAFLAGVEGASGVLELVRARYGVDLASETGLAAAGVDPNAALCLVERDGAVALLASVASPERFARLVAERAERGALAEVAALEVDSGGGGGPSGTAAPRVEDGASPAWRLAWGTTPGGVGIVAAAAGDRDVVEVWRGFAAGAGGLATTERAKKAASGLGSEVGLWIAADGAPPVPKGLGPAGAVLAPWFAGLGSWTGHAALTVESLRTRVDGAWTKEGEMPVGFLAPAAPERALAPLFPKALTAFLRLRVDAERLRKLPGFLRDRILPKRLPGELGRALPVTEAWLEAASGDVAVAVLGLDEEATVDQVARSLGNPDALLQLVHGAAAFAARDAVAASAFAEAARAGFEALGGYEIGPIAARGFTGFTFRKAEPRRTWSVLVAGDAVVLLSGSGEVERFLAVSEGTGSALEGVPGGTASLHLAFQRITRELAEKGLPPYFLQLVSSVRALDLSVDARPAGVALTLDLLL